MLRNNKHEFIYNCDAKVLNEEAIPINHSHRYISVL